MPLAPSIRLPARSAPAVRAIARSWRRLTGGTRRGADRARRTLIACSGGGDSSGLALALAGAVSDPGHLFVVGHIVHDMRPQNECHADRDAVRELAAALGLPFVEAAVAVRSAPGNAEGAARRLRYRALSRMALEHGCSFIATAHHQGDQLESVLMALLRGAGPRGLSGVAASRDAGGPHLIRPALGVGRTELQRLCTASGWLWRNDATNSDHSRFRAAIRHRIAPELELLRPKAAARIARSAALLRDAAGLIQDRTRDLLVAVHAADPADPGVLLWDRSRLRTERVVVLGSLLKAAARRLRSGRGRDRLGSAALEPVVRAIRSRRNHPQTFTLAGLDVRIDSRAVRIQRVHHG